MTCAKCGSADIYTRWHKGSYDCAWRAEGKRRDEHLHRTCRGCGFDWSDDVIARAALALNADEPEGEG